MQSAAGNTRDNPQKEQEWCYRVPFGALPGAEFEKALMLIFPPFFYAQGLHLWVKRKNTFHRSKDKSLLLIEIWRDYYC